MQGHQIAIDRFSTILASWPRCWVVGGAARSAALGTPAGDLDLVVDGDHLALAKALAALPGASLAQFRQTGDTVRVTLPDLPWHIDLSTLAGPTIENDLSQRDFTINALALPCDTETIEGLRDNIPQPAERFIDPCGGLIDLRERRLHQANDHAIADDPLRILRGARLIAALDMKPDDTTLIACRTTAAQLATISPERITTELFFMLAPHGQGTRAMRALDELGALTVLVPPLIPCRGLTQGTLHHWDVFEHSLEVIDALDRVVDLLYTGINDPAAGSVPPASDNAFTRLPHPTALDLSGHNEPMLKHIEKPLAEGQTRLTLLKMAALFHDIGKPATREFTGTTYRFPGHPEAGVPPTKTILQGWKLSKATRRFIETIVLCHMRPGQMAGPHGVSDKAIRLFFRDTGDGGLDTAIFSLADHFAVYGPDPLTGFWRMHYSTVREIVRRYYETPEDVLPSRLIDGNDLQAQFHMTAGPHLREVLESVHQAQLEGVIKTRNEALTLAEQIIRTNKLASS
jgi:tRNA nucleotidyltransferase/poly(A) polymerase